MSRALDVAAAWLRVRETELAFMSQQDETWREMIREGLFRPPPSQRAETNPFSDIWTPRPRGPTTVPPRGRRARTVSQGTRGPPTTPTWLAEWSNPVPVVATPAQISSATEELDFSAIDAPLNERCPITQQVFRPTDRVTRIRRCGHLLETGALRRWFTYSARCPMCRLDIRDAPNSTTAAPDAPTRTPEPPTNSTSLPTPTGLSTEADFAGFASRIASELADQILRDSPSGAGNLTVEYAVVGPTEESGAGTSAPPGGPPADGDDNT